MPQLRVTGIEALQSGQDRQHGIPLFAGRPTAVRVFVDHSPFATRSLVSGELEVRSPGLPNQRIKSVASIWLDRAHNPSLEDQRRYTNAAMMFLVPTSIVAGAGFTAELVAVEPGSSGGEPIVIGPGAVRQFAVGAGPVLRLALVGLRWKRGNQIEEPSSARYHAIRSFVERSFPIGRLDWTAMAVDAPADFVAPFAGGATPDRLWQARHDRVIAYMMALRVRDVAAGCDFRTHYYGLVANPGPGFAGAASNVSEDGDPSTVAVGPALADGAYGAHEIAHTLGALHPGVGSGQTREDLHFPVASAGHLSDLQEAYNGFDVGESNGAPRVLDGATWYDLMTYKSTLWVSAYRHRQLLSRIRDEDAMPAAGPAQRSLVVIGTYVIDGVSGPGSGELANRILHVIPVDRAVMPATTGGDGSPVIVEIRGKDAQGHQLFRQDVQPKRMQALDLHKDTGAFAVSVPRPTNLERLEMLVQGDVVATHVRPNPVAPSPGWSVSPESGGTGTVLVIGRPNQSARVPVTVQVGVGNAWRTIAVDLSPPARTAFLDRALAAAGSQVQLRLVCANGFEDAVVHRQALQLP